MERTVGGRPARLGRETADEHTARTLLDTYYYAPDYAADGVEGMTRWLAGYLGMR